jgi:hypothetical protein
MSFTTIAARCLYISCAHESTLLWDLFDAPTTSHDMLSVCARTFIEIDHDGTRNMIGVQYATPQPWHVLIPWSLDQLISHPSHLVILAFHIHIIIPMQVPCQFLETIAQNPLTYSCWFSSIVSPITSSSFSSSSLPWFYFQNLKGKPKNIGKKFLVQLTEAQSKFNSISIWNLPLNSMK